MVLVSCSNEAQTQAVKSSCVSSRAAKTGVLSGFLTSQPYLRLKLIIILHKITKEIITSHSSWPSLYTIFLIVIENKHHGKTVGPEFVRKQTRPIAETRSNRGNYIYRCSAAKEKGLEAQ